MDPEVETALIWWWEAATDMYNAKWTAGYSTAHRKELHASIVTAENAAKIELYEVINRTCGVVEEAPPIDRPPQRTA